MAFLDWLYRFTNPAFVHALTFVGVLLSLASVAVLVWRRARPQNQTLMKVAVILRSWWWIAGCFMAMMSWYRWGLIVGMFVITILALREYLKVSRVRHKTYYFVALSIVCLLQYATLAFARLDLFLALIPVTCLWLVPGLVIFRATVEDLERVVGVGFGSSLVVYYLSHIVALSTFAELKLSPETATSAVLILILLTWLNDVFQFISGKTFAGPKIVPQVSPNKTLGGFLGGFLGTGLLSALLSHLWLGLGLDSGIFLGLLLSFTGMFGDLFFSAIKRHIGIKDFSQVLPGHGGFLDRLDSLVFTAPVFFHYLLFIAR